MLYLWRRNSKFIGNYNFMPSWSLILATQSCACKTTWSQLIHHLATLTLRFHLLQIFSCWSWVWFFIPTHFMLVIWYEMSNIGHIQEANRVWGRIVSLSSRVEDYITQFLTKNKTSIICWIYSNRNQNVLYNLCQIIAQHLIERTKSIKS